MSTTIITIQDFIEKFEAKRELYKVMLIWRRTKRSLKTNKRNEDLKFNQLIVC